jgi:hypothetical protein
MNVIATKTHHSSDDRHSDDIKVIERFHLLIEGEWVGPFVAFGSNEHLVESLHDRGVDIERYGAVCQEIH